MYESPKLVPINTINAAYGHGAMSMGLCVVNVNAAANANAAVNANVAVNAIAATNAAAAVNAAAAANAVAVVLVINHYSPHGQSDPRNGDDNGKLPPSKCQEIGQRDPRPEPR